MKFLYNRWNLENKWLRKERQNQVGPSNTKENKTEAKR